MYEEDVDPQNNQSKFRCSATQLKSPASDFQRRGELLLTSSRLLTIMCYQPLNFSSGCSNFNPVYSIALRPLNLCASRLDSIRDHFVAVGRDVSITYIQQRITLQEQEYI